MRTMRAGGFLELNKFYIIDPPAPPRKDNKPFWIGRLLRIDTDETHAWVQWMEQSNDDHPIDDPWETREKLWFRTNDSSGIRTLITSLHENIGMIHSTRAKKSTQMKICSRDHKKANYWAERFTGLGSRVEPDEMQRVIFEG